MNTHNRFHRQKRRYALRLGSFLSLLFCAGVLATRSQAQAVTLTLGTSNLHFPSANPTTTPNIPANENPVSIAVAFVGIGHWTLSLIANGDLTSGSATIPVSQVYWTTSSSSFVSGTMSKTMSQPLTSGALVTLNLFGTVNFFLKNSWAYATGTYTSSYTVTVTSF